MTSALSLVLVIASIIGIPAFAGAAELSIALDKTVYLGHDGGAGCPGGEEVEGPRDTAITYCFVVTNTGSEPLAGAAIGDPILSITSAEMTLLSGDPALLAPGAQVVWFYEASITAELVNTATVGAFPLDAAGGPSYGDDPVLASDTAVVHLGYVPPATPGIDIDKTVYEGHDDGGSCPGTDAVTVDAGADLTFCFRVTNTGNTYLTNVTIDDPILGITHDQMTIASGSLDSMAPGAVTDLYFETTAGDIDFVNTASTTGTPSDDEGDEIPDVEPPTDDDDSSVDVDDQSEPATPGIDIDKTVYEGKDAGESCPGEESITIEPGADVTYCFTVTNTGNTYLADVEVNDPDLDIGLAELLLVSGNPALLAPGEQVSWYYEVTLDDGLINTATTTGTPADEEGDEIPDLEPPTDDDDASVDVEGDGGGDDGGGDDGDDDDDTEVLDDDLEVDINIDKVVYEGHTSGSGCSTAGEEVYAEIGTPITYCFIVTNTGTVHLANVVVADPTLGITEADMTLLSGNPAMLAPQATVVWYYETEIVENITNIASTTGTPSEPDGTEIPAEPPTDSDDATVGEEEVLGQELPSTGVDSDLIGLLGGLLLLSGFVLLGTGRRRRLGVASLAASWAAAPRVWEGHSTAPSRDRATARSRRLRR